MSLVQLLLASSALRPSSHSFVLARLVRDSEGDLHFRDDGQPSLAALVGSSDVIPHVHILRVSL